MEPRCYRIGIRGQLGEHFAAAFAGMVVEHSADGTVLIGELADQAQLFGFLERLRDLGLELQSVQEVDQ